ncbi:hypothetical protein SOM12_15410 [Flavobacterium sp. CFBP9031]|uniref:hypothetical protein n=1 Tax=Flavobacterium sp. CFBP9031 TaxID=3096538 RepID=UPI002A69FFAC|nr:hypothetical protein [Flavobacterium sp. CFBP9031]MDY0988819.1 hypothetical protein [Flavobacterium sp. CFBP9031]
MTFRKLMPGLFIFFFSISINSQNTLKSVYDIEDNFPAEMKRAKMFIDKLCSDILIYDLIVGGNNTYSSNYQFKLKSTSDLNYELPYTNGLSLYFIDFKTKKPLKEHTLYVDYSFDYLKYKPEFVLDKNTFSAFSYFNLATEINEYSDKEIVKQILTNLFVEPSFEKRFSLFLKKINGKYKLDNPSPKEVFGEEEELNTDEKIEKITESLKDQFDEEFHQVLFNTFILEKTDDKKTFENLSKLFSKNITESVDDVLQQKILINTNKSCFLKVPNQYLNILNEEHSFPVNSIEIKLDFKNKNLILNFSNEGTKLVLKNSKSVSINKILNEVNVTTNSLQITISELDTKLIVSDKYNKDNYTITLLK